MTKYFKKSYKHSKSHPSDDGSCHINTSHYISPYSDKQKCKSCNNNDKSMKLLIKHIHLIA